MAALGALYLDRLRAVGNDPGYIANRACLLRKHIVPVIGRVMVADWCPEHSVEVLSRAAETLSRRTVDAIRSTLSGMRRTAWLKRPGGRWLARTEDPLEDVRYQLRTTVHGASHRWVPTHLRPATTRVESAISASADLGRWDWMPLCIRLAAFCGLRLGEQLGLRAVDVDFDRKALDINGVWVVESKSSRHGERRVRSRRPYTKTKVRRTVPYIGSIESYLVEQVGAAAGLASACGREAVAAWVRDERARRAALTSSGDWRNHPVPPGEEIWLFADPRDGVPPTKEMFNDAWHRVRDGCQWQRQIPYRNMRHHAATWLHDRGWSWEQIALWLGNDHRTLQGYYVLPNEDLNESARPMLDRL